MTYEEAVQYLRLRHSCKSFTYPVRWESLGPYFEYTAGESEILLDGHFDVKDLEVFLAIMKEHQPCPTKSSED